jgi:hypothetical protein
LSTEALSSFPPQERVALVDLVETDSPDASRAFVALASRCATEVGGRRVLANETLVPMTIPDPESTKADEATRLLVVSEYPTADACRIALSKRKESMSERSGGATRTYAVRPWSKVQAKVIQTIMKGRGLFGRTSVPRLHGDGGAEALESLVRGSAIHAELHNPPFPSRRHAGASTAGAGDFAQSLLHSHRLYPVLAEPKVVLPLHHVVAEVCHETHGWG